VANDEAPVILAAGEGAVHRTPFGDTLVWKAGEDATDGHYSLQERTAPSGARSFPHKHHTFVEAFYVLDGECEFIIGDRTMRGGIGTFVLVPRGTLHAWSVLGDRPLRALVLFEPSLQMAFFEEQQALLESGADAAQLRALAEKFNWT
jgi:quercetin dioxygenase-like cupin family protein